MAIPGPSILASEKCRIHARLDNSEPCFNRNVGPDITSGVVMAKITVKIARTDGGKFDSRQAFVETTPLT